MAQEKNSACANYEADLVLLHYGDLAASERQQLTLHLAGCAGCAAYLQELGALLPLTVKIDAPPPEFWTTFNRELRQKIDARLERKSWRQALAALWTGRAIPAFAAAAIVIIALALTLGNNVWSTKQRAQDDEFAAALPVAENQEFFAAMDVLDDLDLLEFLASPDNNAA